jgi:hypothetical protein
MTSCGDVVSKVPTLARFPRRFKAIRIEHVLAGKIGVKTTVKSKLKTIRNENLEKENTQK